MFQRRHYEAVVRVLYAHRPDGKGRPTRAWAKVCIGFADYFAQDNPRFDRERFLRACRGVTDRVARTATTL